MAESFFNLEDEAIPSFLCTSLDSTSGHPTLGNVTLGSGPGLPVAASTVAKIRGGADDRGDAVEASYLDSRELQRTNSQSRAGEHAKFALSFKDDMDSADDFFAAHRLSDKLVKIHLDETAPKIQSSMQGLPLAQMASVFGRPTELGTELSTGLLTFSQFGHKDGTYAKAPVLTAPAEEDDLKSETVDSNSDSSFLANEKLMSVDSVDSDLTADDDIDLNNLPDDELERYFNKLVPATMQRGRVDGQEIPASGPPGASDDASNPSATEPERFRHPFHDDDEEDFQMPDVRLAATGMDSCPASDEDTEDELECARRNSSVTRTRLLPSTSRQLVGESNRPTFRPGLEGGSSDDESTSGRGAPSQSGIEHRRSAEGQVINPPVTGDGGGGDGSSGSDEGGNDGGVATIPLPSANIQTTYDVLRGLGIVGSSAADDEDDDDDDVNGLPGRVRSSFSRRTEMGDRVGPVGTGEELSSGGTQRTSHVNWSMVLDQKEALDAVESTESGPADERLLDSAYLRSGARHRKPQDPANITVPQMHGTQMPLSDEDEGVDEPDGAKSSLGLRGGPCGDASASRASDTPSEDGDPLSTSLEPKYFFQSFHLDQGDSDDGWNSCSDNLESEFQKGASGPHGVVYQNEEGQWVTDLAYYTSFENVADGKTLEQADHFQTEDFVSAGDALEKIAQDQEEFEKEHQFMQEEQIEAASSASFHADSSWRIPTSSHVLMRASQVSSEFEQGDQSYMRLSLGQFFKQRSEALGCLGSNSDVGWVKRPSFGYIITSPEKREPFPLIHPPEFSPRARSHNATADLSDADKTLKPEDLDNTLEAPGERTSPKGDAHPNPRDQEAPSVCVALPDHGSATQSCVPPSNDGSPLLLSISTISSAIADASVSTDPSQLAAMILEWSQKSKAKSRPEPDVSPAEEQQAAEQIHRDADRNALSQRSTCAGELSAFDMEKYLKKTDVSGSSEASVAHTTFDLTGWAENLSSSQRNLQPGPPQEHGASAPPRGDGETQQKPAGTITEGGRGETTMDITSSAQQSAASSAAASPRHKNNTRRSSIPRYRTSLGSDRRSVGSGQSSTLKSSADSRTDAPAKTEMLKDFSEPSAVGVEEETQCSFRPSTSPVTHSSPSQDSVHSADGAPLADKRPGVDVSPDSVCSSPSLSRLTYISRNDGTVLPSPERQKDNSMALSTTIIRISPTPPVEPDVQSNLDVLAPPTSLDQVLPQHSRSLDPLPSQKCKNPEPARTRSGLSCTRSQSECSCPCAGDRNCNLQVGCRNHKQHAEKARPLTKVDSGYCSNLNVQQPSVTAAPQISQQWGAGALGMSPAFPTDGLHYAPVSGFKPQAAGLMDLPHRGNIQSLLAGHSLFTSHLPPQYLVPDAPLHPAAFHMTAARTGLYSAPPSGLPGGDLTVKHLHAASGPLRISGGVGPFHLPQPSQNQQDVGLMVKSYSQYVAEPLVASSLEEIGGQVVVPEELRFSHSCCVGIASQTSLSLFNPSERWQQVSIAISSLAIDGEKVDSLPYQWLMVKNKTIIGPKSTEDQKVLFVAPQAGVYQCVLSVSSWPASAVSEVAARASLFAKRVVLLAIAENPSLEVDVNESGILDFEDLPENSTRSLPLKLRNRTRATVPIRLVISANATAWPCFSFSKQSVTASDAARHAVHMTQVASSSSVMNHVMHASCGENLLSFTVWVQFRAPQKYAASSGVLGPADEYNARVDIELDCPGPSHVIKSIPLRARCGIARVHAPKDLQTVCLSAALGKSSQQMLPLKNAGNIDVQLKLKSSDTEGCFSVTPNELSLGVAEEQGIVLAFKAHGNRKYRESLLTILVLPSGPQYEVILKGEVTPEGCGRPAAVLGSGLVGDVPPILSNKQFVAWGGVTLGRAVQQKLVLRNNSPKDTQQLRLIIRGQDQDCFQLQSLFSPEERLTRHGELSIRPKEDVTVHLLFAPTRVACMLAKLEIKQSGVRPSQPGVKFTIPLSGYGGTSNIILEDQRKRADGYVAAMADVAVGRVSKVCLCVRNTGSRAAFIKAAVFTDVQTRSVMEPSVVSLAPSQFVLKERTQEVITVLMKSTQREQNLCQTPNSLLATVCLFCGDEVSRQQYRRLLQSKPDAGRKALSENSLLKNIDFSETFLGEETITEAFDLPQRPNEAHIFYGNMSKVVVSLLGSTERNGGGGSDRAERLTPSVTVASDADGGLVNGNVSLDVLPVRGPQGPALRVAEPSLQASEPLDRQAESWTVHPEQLVLAAPTVNSAVTTSHVRIQNNTSRELSFDLSWPAHCLTVTPQHGLIEPQCHLQILISPNPSLATKSALLPWGGQIYVQCDGQQKFIKVQIRRDLALDVSAAPADTSLSALAPQVATPVLPVAARFTATPSLPPQTPESPQSLVEISNKTVIFPTTPSGETSEAHLELENRHVEVRWYLSSFAPPYVKGVDDTGDVYRATYTAFRCSRVSGTLGAHQKMQVPFTFLPRDRGDYAQFWDLECHPVSEPQHKTSIRIQLCGSGVMLESVEGPQEGNCSLVKTEATVKSRKRADTSTLKTSQEEAGRRGVYSPQDLYTFPATRVGECSSLKVTVRNSSSDTHELKFVKPSEPFHLKHSKYSLRSQHYLKLPVQFKPTSAGRHAGLLLVEFQTSGSLVIQLTGEASL